MKQYTMEDFKNKKIAVSFENKKEQAAFLRECERAGLRWNAGQLPTKFHPILSEPYIACRDGKTIGHGRRHGGYYERKGYEFIPFSAFTFSPSHELHITCKDGITTHAIYKEDGKTVRRAKAVKSPDDAFSFPVAAEVAAGRALGEPAKPQAIPAAIVQAAELVATINAKGRDMVFFEISPHVSKVGFRVFLGGWESCKDPDQYQDIYYDKHPDAIRRYLAELKKLLEGAV